MSSSNCLEIEVIFPASLFAIDALEVTLAALAGLVLGIIIALVCSKCFFRELAKERIQQSEKGLELENVRYEPMYPNRKNKNGAAMVAMESEKKKKKKKKKGKKRAGSSASMTRDEDDTTMESYDAEGQDVSNNGSLVYALITTTLEKTQVELSLQDFRSSHIMEDQLTQERSSVFLLLLQVLLGKFVAKERLDEHVAHQFVQKCTESVHDAEFAVVAEHQAALEELKKDPSLAKDQLKLQEAIEQKWPVYQRNMAAVVQNAQLGLQDNLSSDTSLSEEEIDALATKLMENMAASEAMIGQEAIRQSLILQERLAKRQALAEQYKSVDKREQKGNIFRKQDLKVKAEKLCEDEKLTEAQMQSIMKQYEEDLARVQENHQAEVTRNSQQLAEKLQQHRQRRLHQMERKQAEERQQLMSAALKAINPSDFVQAHHDLLEQQRSESNELIDELDYHETQELSTMRNQLEESRVESVEQQEKSYFESIKARAKLNKKEASKMLQEHAANIKQFDEVQEKQKKGQQAQLQEKIETRKAQWEQQWKKSQMEQRQLTEQQEKTVSILLDSQAGMDEDARQKIMLQHEQDTQVLNNHLQMTSLRHQKIVEAKLAKRRARAAMLRQKQEIELASKFTPDASDESEKELQELEQKHEEQLKLEEQDIENEGNKAMAELRGILAKEADIEIKGQDVRLGAYIAKKQVGQARRQAIIKQQDKALKELQDQMVNSVSDGKNLSERRTERIMEEHFEQLQEIQMKIAQAKDHQNKVLVQKLEAIKLKKEKSVVVKLEKEKEERTEKTASKARKIKASALGILNKILEDNRQKQEMDKLDQEMKIEMSRQREELNGQLEEAMEKELEEHERNFVGQLAAVSKMSKQELNEMIYNAVEEGGGDESTVKAMSRDMTKRIKSAKAQPEFYDEEEQDEDQQGDQSEEEERPKKKGRKKKKKAPVYSDED